MFAMWLDLRKSFNKDRDLSLLIMNICLNSMILLSLNCLFMGPLGRRSWELMVETKLK